MPTSLTLCRISATPVLSASHHEREPDATPRVATPAEAGAASAISPALANTAPKAMMVVGFVSVSANALA